MLMEEMDGEVQSERFCSGGDSGKGPGGGHRTGSCALEWK